MFNFGHIQGVSVLGLFLTPMIILTSPYDVTTLILDDNCTNPCDYHGQTFCGHIPCPLPPCDKPLAWNPGDCCQHCPTVEEATMASDVEQVPGTLETPNVTAHFCPYPCTVGNVTLCYPPPCPPPACVNPAKYKPTDCCEYCPDGINCRAPDGSNIKYDHWKMVNGHNCTCKDPGHDTTCV